MTSSHLIVVGSRLEGLWQELVFSYGDRPRRTSWWWDRLEDCWTSEGRIHHDMEHLQSVLNRIWDLTALQEDLRMAEFAAFFHHVVYDPSREDNLEESQNWAIKCLIDLGYPGAWIQQIVDIMTVIQHGVISDRITAVLLDSYRYIYGWNEKAYDYYASCLRKEMAHLPYDDYITWRKDHLNRLLSLEEIYSTGTAFKREAEARRNIAREIKNLDDGVFRVT